ncbi:hypothetical protein PG987_013603 [Apiospora arundinis]
MSSPSSNANANTTDTITSKPVFTNPTPTENELKKWRCSLMMTFTLSIDILRQEHPEVRDSGVWRTATDVFEKELDGLVEAGQFEKARDSMEKALEMAKEMAENSDSFDL